MRTVLIIEDNHFLATCLANQLAVGGTSVHCEHLGLRGIEAAKVLTPAAVIIDANLPDISGREVAIQLATMLPLSSLFIWTGHCHEAAMWAGALGIPVFEKAVDDDRLVATVRNRLQYLTHQARGVIAPTSTK